MGTLRKNVHGEGNKEADRRFREAESRFVHSDKGKQKIAEAGNLSEAEAKRLEKIAEKTKGRARGEDPAVKRDGNRSHH